jgi:hypothetical protein
MVSAKTRSSPGRTPNTEVTGAGTVHEAHSWRRRGTAASSAWMRVAAAGGGQRLARKRERGGGGRVTETGTAMAVAG